MLRTRSTFRNLWLRCAPRHFLRHAGPNRAELGEVGEELTARHLRGLGWQVRGRGLRTAFGEVDLWAWQGPRAWVIEVKTRHVAWHFTGPPPKARAGAGIFRVGPKRGAPKAWSLTYRPSQSLGHAQRDRLARAARDLARRCGRTPALTLVEVFVEEGGRRVELRGPSPCFLAEVESGRVRSQDKTQRRG